MQSKNINGHIYEVIESLKREPSCYTYLALKDNKKYIIRNVFHDDREYLTLEDNLNRVSIAYEKFEKVGLNVSRLVDIDIYTQCIVTEYIEGNSVLDLILNKSLDEKYIYQMLDLQANVIKNEFNINFFPKNFIISDDQIYYIDFECRDYDKKYNFKNYGIYFWIYNRRLKKYSKTHDFNSVMHDSMPITRGLSFKRKAILKRYKKLTAINNEEKNISEKELSD